MFVIYTEAYQEVSALAFSRDERWYAAAFNGQATGARGGAWTVGPIRRGSEPKLTIAFHRNSLSVALSPLGEWLAGVCDGEVRLHWTASGERAAGWTEQYATNVAFAGDSLLVASRGPGGLSRESPAFLHAFTIEGR